MKSLWLAVLFTIPVDAATVPDFHVRVGLEPASKIPRWLVELTPPSAHHFNLKAPMKAEVPGKLQFKDVKRELRQIGFAGSSLELQESDRLEVSAFLCDDAKTYCVKKTVTTSLKVDPTLRDFGKGLSQTSAGSGSKGATPSAFPSKDRHGFWIENPAGAIAEARNTGKPILIDFFGVWCPPCNLYEELVFPKPSFRGLSRKMVLLKMDADRETSYELKAKFSVGGYPTLILAKVSAGGDLSEIGRVVGYRPEGELVAKLGSFLKLQGMGLEERIAAQRDDLLNSLRLKIERELEAKNASAALQAIDEALTIAPTQVGLKLDRLQARSLSTDSFRWENADSAVIEDVFKNSKNRSAAEVLAALGFLSAHFDSIVKEVRALGDQAILDLRTRIDPKSLSIPGVECSLADLDILEMEIAKSAHEGERESRARKNAIRNLQSQMDFFKNPDSRGMNLDLAGLYLEDGQRQEALQIYSRFILKYPAEFTFHYAAAKAHLEGGDFKSARQEAEQAVRYAYGDNLIRCMDRLLKVMQKQGEIDFALRRGESFLKDLNYDPALKVRTGRYVAALKSTLEALRKEAKTP